MVFISSFDIVINIYTSLGYATKEHRIESKMEKIRNEHPKAYEIYVQNKMLFDTDEELGQKIMSLNVKDKKALNNTIEHIYTRFFNVA